MHMYTFYTVHPSLCLKKLYLQTGCNCIDLHVRYIVGKGITRSIVLLAAKYCCAQKRKKPSANVSHCDSYASSWFIATPIYSDDHPVMQ